MKGVLLPPGDVGGAGAVKGKDIRQLLAPALLVQQRLVALVLAAVAVQLKKFF